jgi:hypothetical protein
MLEINIEYVYFLMGLSKRGAPIIYFGHRSTPLPTEAYVVQYCVTKSHLVGGRIVIKDVMDLSL